MKRSKKKNNFDSLKEKALSWFWVILFISAIFFLRSLLVDMHTETVRIAEEREQLEKQMDKERERSKALYEEFYAEINESIRKAIEAVNKGEPPR